MRRLHLTPEVSKYNGYSDDGAREDRGNEDAALESYIARVEEHYRSPFSGTNDLLTSGLPVLMGVLFKEYKKDTAPVTFYPLGLSEIPFTVI